MVDGNMRPVSEIKGEIVFRRRAEELNKPNIVNRHCIDHLSNIICYNKF